MQELYRGVTLLSCPGKVFAHVLLTRVKEKLLAARRKQQSGFTPGRTITDRIFKLNLLLQGRREYQRQLWIAYVDLKAAFNSVNRSALWMLLHTIGHSTAGRSGLAVACLTAVREVLGSNRTVGSCVYRTTTAIYSLAHELCAPFLQCLGQLSLLPYVGR